MTPAIGRIEIVADFWFYSVSELQGISEDTTKNQNYPDYSAVYQFREVQRRMVEFIRKRYLLLEKVLNAECHKAEMVH